MNKKDMQKESFDLNMIEVVIPKIDIINFRKIEQIVEKEEKDLTQYVKTFFGNRNNINFEDANLREGVNYTNQTLDYMTAHDKADRITEEIVKRMMKKPFTIVETSAGIGGNSLSFLDNENIEKVILYEKNDDRRKMLENNLKAYHFENYEIKEEFKEIIPEYFDDVLFIDPPWDDVRDGEIYFADRTLDKWVNSYNKCPLIVIKTPINYTIKNISLNSFKISPVDYKNIRVYYIMPMNMTSTSINKTIIDFNNSMMQRFNYEKSGEWVEKFKKFIEFTLVDIIRDEEMRNRFIEDKMMEIWIRAFTHESFDLTDNYEDLELRGDRYLETAFTEYIIQHIKNPDKATVTQIKRSYMSQGEHGMQSEFSRKLNFDNYIRYIGSMLSPKIMEDVFESFIGALYIISEMTLLSSGMTNCIKFIDKLFGREGINMEYAKESSKTLVGEIFRSKGWGAKPDHGHTFDAGQHISSVILTDKAIIELKKNRILIPQPPIIGQGKNTNKKNSETEAYDNALEWLKRIGITIETIREEKLKKSMNRITIQQYEDRLNRKLREAGFKTYKVYSNNQNKTINAEIVGLYGIREDKSSELLAAVVAPNIYDGEKMVIELYVSERS